MKMSWTRFMPKVIFTVQFNAMSPPPVIAFPLQKKEDFFLCDVWH